MSFCIDCWHYTYIPLGWNFFLNTPGKISEFHFPIWVAILLNFKAMYNLEIIFSWSSLIVHKKAKVNILYFYLLVSTIFTFFYINRRKYWFRVNFRLQFLYDLYALRCPEHDLTISGKCLSVCVIMCVWRKFCGKCRSKTNQQN